MRGAPVGRTMAAVATSPRQGAQRVAHPGQGHRGRLHRPPEAGDRRAPHRRDGRDRGRGHASADLVPARGGRKRRVGDRRPDPHRRRRQGARLQRGRGRMKTPNEPSRLEKGHHMSPKQAIERQPNRSRSRVIVAGAAALAAVVVAVARCAGGYGGGSSPSTSAPSASAQKGGSGASAAPSSNPGTQQKSAADTDGDKD